MSDIVHMGYGYYGATLCGTVSFFGQKPVGHTKWDPKLHPQVTCPECSRIEASRNNTSFTTRWGNWK